MPTIRVDTQKRPDGSIVATPIGEAGVAEAYEFERQLMELLDGKPPGVVVDLSQLAFISSTAIGSLLNFHKAMQRLGSPLRLAAPQPQVLESLRHARIDKVMPINATVAI